jgi:hypothetical protein
MNGRLRRRELPVTGRNTRQAPFFTHHGRSAELEIKAGSRLMDLECVGAAIA